MTGTGTIGDPFIIQNVTDLQAMENDLSAYYELEGDIDASATSGWNGGLGFDSVGGSGTEFTGQLDGKDFTISSLFINRPSTNGVGLFGYVFTALAIKNVHLTSVDITGAVDAGALVGDYIGDPGGYIDNCDSTGSVTGDRNVGGLIGEVYVDNTAYVRNCWSACTITSTKSAGGFAGSISGAIGSSVDKCYGTGNITITSGDVFTYGGGFVARASRAIIDQCYATGNVSASSTNTGSRRVEVGGFVGASDNNAMTITNCYAEGNTIAIATNGLEFAGGFIGRLADSITGPGESLIDDCYSTGATTLGNTTGGFCAIDSGDGTITNCFWDTETSGQATSDGGTGKTTVQMKTKATFTGAGWSFIAIWFIDGITNNGYPFLGQGVVTGPSDPVSRVSSIRHIYKPGSLRMETTQGALGFETEIAEATVRRIAGIEPEFIVPTPAEIATERTISILKKSLAARKLQEPEPSQHRPSFLDTPYKPPEPVKPGGLNLEAITKAMEEAKLKRAKLEEVIRKSLENRNQRKSR